MNDPISKFIDFVQKQTGYLFEPRHQRRLADAKAYGILTEANAQAEAMKIMAQAEREIEDHTSSIQITKTQGEIASYSSGKTSEPVLSLPERATVRQATQAEREQENIDAIFDSAYDQLRNDDHASDEPVEADWATQFVHSARMISDEKMQVLFGKILAGEIKQPGTFGVRTIEVLRNMSKKEAELFQKMASLVVKFQGNLVIPNVDISLFEEFGVNAETFIILGEMSLLSEMRDLNLNYACSPTRQLHIIYGDSIILTAAKDEVRVKPPIFRITTVGMQLYSLVQPRIHPTYISSIVVPWGRTMKVPLTLGKITKVEGEIVHYNDVKPL